MKKDIKVICNQCNTSIVVSKKMSNSNNKLIDMDVITGRKVNSNHFKHRCKGDK